MARLRAIALSALALSASASLANADVLWDEAVNGDLSGDGFAPNSFILGAGSHSISATSNTGDRDYVTFSIPAGFQLNSILLASYVGDDITAFMGVQSGTTFTEPPTGTNVANLLGYTHFGPGPGLPPGSELIDSLSVGPGAIGFTPPLASGNYAFWMQQTGASLVTYQIDFGVTAVPEPAGAALIALAGLALRLRR